MNRKNNNSLKTFALLLLIVMLALILIASTYAKYTTKLTGSSDTTIAKWAWTINNNDVSKDDTEFTFDLFKTIKDTDGGTEADVTTQKIAPGTKGSFSIEVTNASDVNAEYRLTLTETKATAVSSANIEYSIVGTDEATDWTNDIGTFNFTNTRLAIGASNEVVLYWRWAFYDDANQDKADTLVGFAAAGATDDADKSITIKADLNFTQVD